MPTRSVTLGLSLSIALLTGCSSDDPASTDASPFDIPARIEPAFGAAWVSDSGSSLVLRIQPQA